ncbi:formate dehydrogenase accessory protein FdhE [Pseudothauera nasutitermitis]|uniref:Protein FdhE homolog n=1 Tax=Pseudothauera nasutitermitis TaxID=2565930 RepID=A0A4S4AWW6_9RHOO|nr:formate dehydrogenase accessory protein FdhE [Pseudothauera nasutitermitis]THF64552.1 formate dehydrogenase accessory protein FdhE [Pseudothauera nasutitermitis]
MSFDTTQNPLAGVGQINPGEKPADVHPPVRPAVFADRARRFDALAAGHALGDYLRLLGRISALQHECLRDHPAVALPTADALARALEFSMPPVPVTGWPRDPAWRTHLKHIVAGLRTDATPAVAAVLDAIDAADEAELERLADAVLAADYAVEGAAGRLPLIAAALQVYWTHMACAPELAGLKRLDVDNVCPCCGSLPVTSVLRIGYEVANLRYLHCSICNTEWNLTRARCVSCGELQKISYRHIEGSQGSVRAECCEACHGYLKIVQQDKDPLVDPVADDLASLTLDLLVDEAGFERTGPNPLFIPGNTGEA